jgi:hypothetical protein
MAGSAVRERYVSTAPLCEQWHVPAFFSFRFQEVHILDVSNSLLNAEQRWNLFLGANMFLLGSFRSAESENNIVVPINFCFAGSSGPSLLRNKRL